MIGVTFNLNALLNNEVVVEAFETDDDFCFSNNRIFGYISDLYKDYIIENGGDLSEFDIEPGIDFFCVQQ